jgi:hypothetical protein
MSEGKYSPSTTSSKKYTYGSTLVFLTRKVEDNI